MNLLHIDSSILGEHSVSRQLTSEVVESIRLAEPTVNVVYRDVTRQLNVQLDDVFLAAKGTPAEARNAEQAAQVALSEAVMAEFLAADVLVIGAPMYNFSVPSQLKAWIDMITVAGVTFKYGSNGPEGLAKGKRAIIVATAGGLHQGTATGVAHIDYLRVVLGFLGISDIRVIAAEGLNMGPEVRDPALASARENLSHIA
ncbi:MULTISPECIES: FMN-dependent NADH-azoreductase [Deefgea]|uniref:FMN dependent NADH:quinone oxidoreductase n=1 Tax=Deefgea chitinilytica TaxID=570276 RepID=A0ABS2CES6_9NEIS|nr:MULTISPECIES: NAD(P)H-dependent oxidoreductase [Deefgea]MBM5572645.1 FMN-dependent NADH-azoreductase [Deefgea chitinilytica]MBM9889881.1 NAD(P)H-dependent oxidoreductase [Deefgea sp. CFH1-16]